MSSTYSTTMQTVSVCGTDYHIQCLKDLNQFSDPEQLAEKHGISSAMWPVFGVIWPAGLILADMMDSYAVTGMRILELGCGLGIASLVAQARGADITASDQHPLARQFLSINAALNNLVSPHFECCDWADKSPSLGTFDLIIGSDLLYERNHPQLLSEFIDLHTNQPVVVIIIDPGRHQQGKFIQRMKDLGFHSDSASASAKQQLLRIFKGKILTFTR